MNSASGILTVLQSSGIVTSQQAQKYPSAVSDLVDAFVKFFNAVEVFPPSASTQPALSPAPAKTV